MHCVQHLVHAQKYYNSNYVPKFDQYDYQNLDVMWNTEII